MKKISVVSCWLLLVASMTMAQEIDSQGADNQGADNTVTASSGVAASTAEIQSGTAPTYKELEKQLQEKNALLAAKDNQILVLKVKMLEVRSECNSIKADYDKVLAFFLVLLNDPRSKTDVGFLFSQVSDVVAQIQK